jgi:diaminohydroxyphosphoribosylaminopyrimidine deaminase/5-amino-6-(5-phosphoribosylamino)uracil reductase
LREHNIDVILIESQEALDLNKEFFTNQRYRRPFIIAKAAITRDEQMAKDDGSSKWISCEKSRAYTHDVLRSGVNAILTTAKTVLTDDARFTIRTNETERELTTIVIDRNLELLKNKNLAIHYTRKSSKLFIVAEKIPTDITLNSNNEIIESTFIDGKLEFESLLTQLYKNHSIYSLLIEAGPTFLNALLDKNWVDEFVLFKSPNSFYNSSDRFKLDLSKLSALKEEASWELGVDVVKTYSTQNWRVHNH